MIEELGIPCEKVKVALGRTDTQKPEFLKLNPNGKVPLLVHDGTPVFESAAITMYLGETFGVAKGLYPELGPRRADAMKWIVWSNVSLGQAMLSLRLVPESGKEAAMADVHHQLRILEGALTGQEFLAGSYSLADTHVNSFLDWLRFSKIDFAAYPALNAFSDRCKARPAYQKWIAAAMAAH